jgi:hypothetical protein
MSSKIFIIFIFWLVLIAAANAQSFAPVDVRIEASPEYAPGMIRANTPFTIDLYLDNYGSMELPGIVTALRFYSPDGISGIIPIAPDSGTVYLGNVALLNGFGTMGYWDLFNIVEGYSWDASLPDTILHYGASFFGGWPAGEGEQLHYSFSFKIAEEGTFCIEWVDPTVIDTNYAIEFENVLNFQSKCWSINDVGICGDFNGNGAINLYDIVHVIKCLYHPAWQPCDVIDWVYDVNNDGNFNILDIAYLIDYLYLDGPDPNCPPPPEP